MPSTTITTRTHVRTSSRSSRTSIICNDEDKIVMPTSIIASTDEPYTVTAPLLPNEIIDLILDALFTCRAHPQASRHAPCTAWHSAPTAGERSPLSKLLPLRLVNRTFATRLTPILFHHMTCRSPAHRYRMLVHFSNKPLLVPYIRILRIDVAPADLGARMRRVTQHPTLAPAQKLFHYFEVLRMVLAPILKKFKALKTLHMTTSYDGISGKRMPNHVLEVLPACFDALVESIRKADLEELEEVQLGLPYEGGYTNFFADLDDNRYKTALKKCGKNVASASIKLFDNQNNFTTMSFF